MPEADTGLIQLNMGNIDWHVYIATPLKQTPLGTQKCVSVKKVMMTLYNWSN